ncbi:putative metallo-beta-lactamase superfamily [Candidatus Vecturithrix granuli]|uniref:Putative metallo-beta-lactamase superfamily n=1 Tax=Vecturithrix granuli TaxID=1499967 RepID=A0A081BX60_VECG1|nr:putative metallo-beta-lactamase superfamily [Candidatus Vecturithrix granuli]
MIGIYLDHLCTRMLAEWAECVFPFVTILYALVGILCYLSYRFKCHKLTTGVLILLALLTGISRSALSRSLPDHHIVHLVHHDDLVTVEGFLDKPIRQIGKRRYLDVWVNWVEKEAFRYPTEGRIRITLTGASLPDSGSKKLLYGQAIRTRLRLRLPRSFSDFDYREYLRRQGIYLIGYLRHDRYLIQLPLQEGSKILRGIYQCQHRIQNFLDEGKIYSIPLGLMENTSTDQAFQVIKAMTIGASHALMQEVRDQFRQAGLYHLLVISGIHVSIVVWAFHKFANLLALPLRYRSLVLSGLLLFYAGISGFYYPVLRAVIMAIVFYAALTCNRISEPLYSLAFSVGCLLLAFPNSLFEISFQLTVAATASILLFFRFLHRQPVIEPLFRLPKIARVPITTCLTTFGALLGVAPLLIYYFGDFSAYSFLSNPLAFPIVSALLPSSLFTNFLALVVPRWDVLSPFLTINVLLAKLFIGLSSWFPATGLTFPKPSWIELVGYYVIVYSVLGFFRFPKWKVASGCVR